MLRLSCTARASAGQRMRATVARPSSSWPSFTRLMGSGAKTLVLEQYRWDDSVNNRGFRVSGYAPASRIWNCANWASGTAGSCVVP